MIDLQLWEEFKKYREKKLVLAYKALGQTPTPPQRVKSFWFFKCYDKGWGYYDSEMRNYISQRDLTIDLMVPKLTIEAFFDWVSSREKTAEFHLGKKFKTKGGWDATIVYIGEKHFGVIHHVPKDSHWDGGEEFNWHSKDGSTTYGMGKYDLVKKPSNSLGTTLNTQLNQSTVFGSGLEGKVLIQQDLESKHQPWKNKPDEEA